MTIAKGELRIDLHMPPEFRLRTRQLELVPAGPELGRTDWNDHDGLSTLLGAKVAQDWPPEPVLNPDDPEDGWWDWFIIRHEQDSSEVIGVAGVRGWPAATGSVQLGCTLVPTAQGKGHGTEAVEMMTSWLLSQPNINRVTAQSPTTHEATQAVLRKLGFSLCASEGLSLTFERTR